VNETGDGEAKTKRTKDKDVQIQTDLFMNFEKIPQVIEISTFPLWIWTKFFVIAVK
jgi:hypothetical protein